MTDNQIVYGSITALVIMLAMAMCYWHGAADPLLLRDICPLAKPAEYRELAQELRRIGYKLDIRQRTGQRDLEMRREQLK